MINFKKYGKRCLSLFLAASMILMPSVQTFAEEETAAATTDSTQTEEEDRETQRQNCYAIAPDSNSVENWPQGPATYADSAIVMDMNSGAVLYSKQIEKKHYPASITKLLTTLVALDNAELTDTVEFFPGQHLLSGIWRCPYRHDAGGADQYGRCALCRSAGIGK